MRILRGFDSVAVNRVLWTNARFAHHWEGSRLTFFYLPSSRTITELVKEQPAQRFFGLRAAGTTLEVVTKLRTQYDPQSA